jgi:LacI family transcriptional regulator
MIGSGRENYHGGWCVKRRVTIKDIATQAGVSLGTVHCALAGKAGVSEATRRRILEIARKNDYRPNSLVASLKRKAINIAAAFPGATEENRFYFSPVWNGVRNY